VKFRLSSHSIAHYAAQPANNYLLLRFLAALMVIYGHSYALSEADGGMDVFQRLLSFVYSGDIGVYTFFVISGFLVTHSYLTRRKLADFAKARVLRIFPALAVCLTLTAFVLGPLVSTAGLSHYWLSLAPFAYVAKNLTLIRMQSTLPGVFANLPLPAVNGSLWTLPAEVRLYGLLAIFGASGILFQRRWYFWFILALSVIAALLPFDVPLFFSRTQSLPLFLFFGLGSVMCVYRDRIPLNTWLMLLLLAVALPFHGTRPFHWLLGIWLAYAVLWFAYIPNFHWFNRAGDYSYGLYIYAFPIQQTLRQYFEHIRPLQMFVAASIFTLMFAALSWHLIEKPALRLKSVDLWEHYCRLVGRKPRVPQQSSA
jgi:peptidoglycan/LPS O-acetylase OafA/YrhL